MTDAKTAVYCKDCGTKQNADQREYDKDCRCGGSFVTLPWLADHDAALARAVREQYVPPQHDPIIEWRRDASGDRYWLRCVCGWNINGDILSLDGWADHLPPPVASEGAIAEHDERIRLEARLEQIRAIPNFNSDALTQWAQGQVAGLEAALKEPHE